MSLTHLLSHFTKENLTLVGMPSRGAVIQDSPPPVEILLTLRVSNETIILAHIVFYPQIGPCWEAGSVQSHLTPGLQRKPVGVGWMSTQEEIAHCFTLPFSAWRASASDVLFLTSVVFV